MPDHSGPTNAACEDEATRPPQDESSLVSRSAYPDSQQSSGILESPSRYPLRQSPALTDSGTEADDEHYLKGLPAPRRLHKGLRGQPEQSSGASTPFVLSSQNFEEEGRRLFSGAGNHASWVHSPTARSPVDKWRRKRARTVTRRCAEAFIIFSLGMFVCANPQVQPLLHLSSRDFRYAAGAVVTLIILYPLRLLLWAYWRGKPTRKIPITVPSSFDPAPLLYPPTITIFASLLIAVDNPATLLPNIILALCSLPRDLIPTFSSAGEDVEPLHWVLSCVPLVMPRVLGTLAIAPADHTQADARLSMISPEAATLLYPLHCSLLRVLHTLTTTSLLTAELQLLSIGLINILLLSSSPQITIMKAMLWIGGLDILVCCNKPIQWGIALARVPKWRFKRPSGPVRPFPSILSTLAFWRRMKHDLLRVPLDTSGSSSETVDESDYDESGAHFGKGLAKGSFANLDGAQSIRNGGVGSPSGVGIAHDSTAETTQARTHILPGKARLRKPLTHTPSGRKKRSASASMKAFSSLTYQQAVSRKWLYALYVYICIVGAVFMPLPMVGIKEVVMHEALRGDEPVGWALGYLFGDNQWFRWQVVSHNIQRWIPLPPRSSPDMGQGRIEQLQSSFGEANTRLLLAAYCIGIIITGLLIVSRLSPVCEVDTRRKVFHFMMVLMFLPATYVDPCFVALAFAIVLAIFLLLDLLRASQLPPLSKPLAYFLAPYVDGRDLRGPVVISHIFLLIGCAIPLWLSLGSLPRTGLGHLVGWQVPSREVAMVSGIVCVGLGDAAASLIGRRFGRRKWLWGGGKSLEGSAAFAIAVFLGLTAAQTWLRLGGWATTTTDGSVDDRRIAIQRTGVCAAMASLTEAVLTGGNDNVIVPVVLWACVKSLSV